MHSAIPKQKLKHLLWSICSRISDKPSFQSYDMIQIKTMAGDIALDHADLVCRALECERKLLVDVLSHKVFLTPFWGCGRYPLNVSSLSLLVANL